MKNAPAAVVTFLNGLPAGGRVGWRADLFTLTRLDGTTNRWTSADADIKVGANTWSANLAVLQRSNIRITSRGEIDNLQVDLSALVQLSGKSIGLLAAQGAFFGARLQLDHLVGPDAPTAIGYGPILAWYEGRVAAMNISGNVVRMTVESDLAALDRFVLPQFLVQASCSHAVYDPNCTLVKATFTNAATVSNNGPTTTSITSTTAAVIAKANGFYELGVLVFTSGALNGLRRAVRTFTVSGGVGTIVLALPLPSAPAVADAFSIYPGCNKTEATCVTKFNNLVNFRGFPHVPASEGAL